MQVRLGEIPELDPPVPAEPDPPEANANDPESVLLLHDASARDQGVHAVTRSATRGMRGVLIEPV
jgi:hypothetical protein